MGPIVGGKSNWGGRVWGEGLWLMPMALIFFNWDNSEFCIVHVFPTLVFYNGTSHGWPCWPDNLAGQSLTFLIFEVRVVIEATLQSCFEE